MEEVDPGSPPSSRLSPALSIKEEPQEVEAEAEEPADDLDKDPPWTPEPVRPRRSKRVQGKKRARKSRDTATTGVRTPTPPPAAFDMVWVKPELNGDEDNSALPGSDPIDPDLEVSAEVAEPDVQVVEGEAALNPADRSEGEGRGEGALWGPGGPDPVALAAANGLLQPRCRFCGVRFPGVRELTAHTRQRHPGSAPLQCAACGEAFTRVPALEKHLQDVHFGARPFPCPEPGCGRSFAGAAGLQTHLGTHSGQKPHLCHTCGKAFLNVSTLHSHVRIHTGEKPHLCDTCGKAFINSSTLQVHIRTHTGVRPYRCETCGHHFNEKSKLQTHLRTHTGERPHQCSSCPRSFGTRGALQAHTRTHTGEKPHVCETCGRAFSQSGTLQTHVRTHTGERPFSCTECPKRFTTRSALRVHMRQHSGDRPYPCNRCPRAFLTASSLQIHENSHKREDALAKLRVLAAAAAAANADPDELTDEDNNELNSDLRNLPPRFPTCLLKTEKEAGEKKGLF